MKLAYEINDNRKRQGTMTQNLTFFLFPIIIIQKYNATGSPIFPFGYWVSGYFFDDNKMTHMAKMSFCQSIKLFWNLLYLLDKGCRFPANEQILLKS